MFLGEYRHSIDDKGRLTMPSRFRDGLGGGFVLTKGLDGCLFAYPPGEWEILERKLKSLPSNRAETRAFVRLFFAGASECELDRQGRVLLPNNLREYARLKRDAVIIGVSNRVEIWAAEEWEEYSRDTDFSYGDLAEKLPDFDF